MRKSLKLTPAMTVALIACLAAGQARADSLPPPTASYDATLVSDIGKNHTTGTINAIGPKQRLVLEFPKGQEILFLEWDTSKAYLMVPAVGTALALNPKQMSGYDLNQISRLPVTPEGKDFVSGVDATRYAVTAQDQHGRFDGHIWATAGGAILRIKGDMTSSGKPTPVDIELSNFHVERQNPALVALPPNITPIPLQFGPLLGQKGALPVPTK